MSVSDPSVLLPGATLERALDAGWAALTAQRELRLKQLDSQALRHQHLQEQQHETARMLATPNKGVRPSASLSLARPPPTSPAARSRDAAMRAADKAALATAVEALRVDLASACSATESRVVRAQAEARFEAAQAQAESDVRAARAEAALAREEADRAAGALLARQRAEAAARDELSAERTAREEAEAELHEQDVHVAGLTNELRMVHEAALATASERAEVRRRLQLRNRQCSATTHHSMRWQRQS